MFSCFDVFDDEVCGSDGTWMREQYTTDGPRESDIDGAAFTIQVGQGSDGTSRYSDRAARQSQLAGHGPLRPPLYQHFVSNDVHLIHPEHPAVNPGS